MSKAERLVIGLTGQPSSGKQKASEYLEEQYGFTPVSGGEILREQLRSEGNTPDKLAVSALATHLRNEEGPDALVRRSFELFEGNITLDGLRHPTEAELVRQWGGVMVAIVCPRLVRYGRIADGQRDNRPDDRMSYEEFIAFEQKESAGEEPNDHNVYALLESADYTICNAHGFDITAERLDEVYASLQQQHSSTV